MTKRDKTLYSIDKIVFLWPPALLSATTLARPLTMRKISIYDVRWRRHRQNARRLLGDDTLAMVVVQRQAPPVRAIR